MNTLGDVSEDDKIIQKVSDLIMERVKNVSDIVESFAKNRKTYIYGEDWSRLAIDAYTFEQMKREARSEAESASFADFRIRFGWFEMEQLAEAANQTITNFEKVVRLFASSASMVSETVHKADSGRKAVVELAKEYDDLLDKSKTAAKIDGLVKNALANKNATSVAIKELLTVTDQARQLGTKALLALLEDEGKAIEMKMYYPPEVSVELSGLHYFGKHFHMLSEFYIRELALLEHHHHQ